MVSDDEDARGDEGVRGKGNDGPCLREVLEIDKVAEYGEDDFGERKSICEYQQDVNQHYDLFMMLIPGGDVTTTRHARRCLSFPTP